MAQSLQSFHTFSLKSQCSQLIEITDSAQLQQLTFDAPFCILGEGSNTVFLNDYQGTVIKMATAGVQVIERQDDYLLEVAAGENWHKLVAYTLKHGIPGLENLALIPGTVGAAPVQNIGAYGVELAKFIAYVEYFDISSKQLVRLTAEQCEFGYRDSIFKHALKNKAVITSVGLALPKLWQPELSYGPLQQLEHVTPIAVFEHVIKTRNSKLPDPYVLANAGSFFKNPIIENRLLRDLLAAHPQLPHYHYDNEHHKVAAGWLIEQAGLKGHRIAGIEVHQQQALVLVNHGDSSGEDLVAMIKYIQQQIWQRYQIKLQHEVRLMNSVHECHIGLGEAI
ncbi:MULTISPECIES: UDP-N-acetylmuramate dehydrogenase [Pseudoalteromonas]|uniref:UDP-N-acetylenolpyruvoylglucosamine reductase n=1 Tax=Pseudoalteromonas haloplanktis TaxID=228 RepID=A0ABU1BHZ2_PSEHA|nr:MULTISPECIES: UDP-N-acetylmuramate dehydrogenase [Pseudoalteromonas]MCF6145723.1 UDP-N-acetylmuramate dehydrogenase [Pseudoalteromonas mariniglutinosa NCIMB 1770]MDQ9093950.1 UDP-N-acetylmuramate dehydrogenase [Pseudoalteromonas haloplanktis]TMN68769.1 UDP-N-acetylmuramate dehydrogenase [Pseudoalteromonas sp. S1727]BDF95851.1 UDP-N-acetylenolpyruvoylglucosamine reductase [Pseudoalteromonas sp. KAN5]